MKNKNVFFASFLSLVLSVGITSCTSNKTEDHSSHSDPANNSEYVDEHNSQNSVDWAGTYKGTIPCADCEGIETTLELKDNGEYILKSKYLTPKANGTTEEEKGTFQWDKTGSVVTLSQDNRKFKVGENQVFFLDTEGKIIEGNLAEHYILKKI